MKRILLVSLLDSVTEMSHLKIYYILMEKLCDKRNNFCMFASPSVMTWQQSSAGRLFSFMNNQILRTVDCWLGWKGWMETEMIFKKSKQTNEQAVLLTISQKNEIPRYC